ncbi:hypothetical protein C4564_00135 [Candidatus Microgenomates bacterium]|nr:MAG: hypothetical protein C4564_00135 [Candidatus Microgenomates bacterium]
MQQLPQTSDELTQNIPFTKYVLLAVLFFVLTPATLFISIFSLFTISSASLADSKRQEVLAYDSSSPPVGVNIFASLPSDIPSVGGTVVAGDSRVQIIKNYLHRYDSPLLAFAQEIVKAADAYDIDFRLITAIAQQESNLCKKIPPETYNCWGWGIHSRGTLGFSSYKEGIYTVSRGLKKEYYDKGYTDPNDIMTKYTPLSNGSWAHGVNTFMEDMQ